MVVANLVVAGLSHGLHLFILQLRNKNGTLMPGITVADCGEKMGTFFDFTFIVFHIYLYNNDRF